MDKTLSLVISVEFHFLFICSFDFTVIYNTFSTLFALNVTLDMKPHQFF